VKRLKQFISFVEEFCFSYYVLAAAYGARCTGVFSYPCPFSLELNPRRGGGGVGRLLPPLHEQERVMII